MYRVSSEVFDDVNLLLSKRDRKGLIIVSTDAWNCYQKVDVSLSGNEMMEV